MFGLIFSLCLLFNSVLGHNCENDRNCNIGSVKCGFCVENYCQFPFTNIYTPGTNCSFNTNKCKKESCVIGSIKSKPMEGYSTCVCDCSNGFYGQYCGEKGDLDANYPSGIQLIGPTAVECLVDYSVFVTVYDQGTDASSYPHNLTMVLTTASGVVGAIATTPTLRKVTSEEAAVFCKQHSWDANICQYFVFNKAKGSNLVFILPLRVPFWYPVNWRWNNETELSMSGLTHTLSLKVTRGGLELNMVQQRFVVSHTGLQQSEIPVPKIYNCGKSIEFPVSYIMKQEIDLRSTMLFTNKNQFNVNITLREEWKNERKSYFEWKVFRAESNFQQPEYNYIGKRYWRVSPFSWKHGLYVVRLDVCAVDLIRTDNFGQCYIKIVLEPLVASIKGGVQKVVNIVEDLVMDPSGSLDPNQPPGHGGLKLTMSCNSTEEDVCREVHMDGLFYNRRSPEPFYYSVRNYQLQENRVYKFTLKVEVKDTDYKLTPAYTHQLVTAKRFPLEVPVKSFEIECFYNCHDDVNVQEIIYLKLRGCWKLLGNSSQYIQWRVTSGDQELNLTELRGNHMNVIFPHILIVLENKLKENSTYQFEVTYKNTELVAIHELTTAKSTDSQCSVEPHSGFASLTLFKITCNSSGFVDSYEFYEIDSESDGLNGRSRMLATRKTGELDNVILSGGTIKIITFSKNRIKTTTMIQIKLQKDSWRTIYTTDDYWNMLDELANEGNIELLPRLSVLAENVILSEDKKSLLRLLTLLNKVQLQTFSDAKLCTSTLRSLLSVVDRVHTPTLGLAVASQVAVTLDAISRTLMQVDNRRFSFGEYYQICRCLLDSIDIVLGAGSDVPLGSRDLKYSFKVGEIKKLILNTLRRMGMVLLSKHLPEQEPARIKSADGDIVISAKVAEPISFANGETCFEDMWTSSYFSEVAYIDSGPVTIPEDLMQSWKQIGYYVGLQVTCFTKWWRREVKSDIVHVQICYKHEVDNECSYPHWLQYPILVNFHIEDLHNNVEFHSDNVTRLNELKSQEDLDLETKILRIDVPPGACFYVTFLLPREDDELIMVVSMKVRPSYDMVERKGTLIYNTSSYQMHCVMMEQPRLYYMGIIAGERVPLHDIIHFKYKAVYQRCLRWNERLQKWDFEGSLIATKKIVNPAVKLICQWSRTSVFAAEVGSTSVVVAGVNEFPLHFTPWSNRKSVLKGLVLIGLLIILCFILAWWMDRHQRMKCFVIVLSDNFPREKNGYLICVKTGTRLSAGTDANVGIRLHGSVADSRAHILHSPKHKVMGWHSEGWFQVFTHRHLGTLESLHLWHDNSGESPAWFCDSILVFDMKKENCYYFVVNEWINISVTNIPEVIVEPMQLATLTTWCSKLTNHIKSGFYHHHLWIATVFRHPRDPIRRTDRLMVVLCFIFTSLLISVLLVILSDGGIHLEVKEDLPSYSVERRDVVISLLSMVVSTLVARLMLFMVRKPYMVWYCSKEEEKIKVDGFSCRSAQYAILRKNSKYAVKDLTYFSFHSRNLIGVRSSSLKQFIALQFMEQPLVPVQLPRDKSAVSVNNVWRCKAILFCLMVVLLSMFSCVMLSDIVSPNRLKRWISLVVGSILVHAFIFLPFKILITSLVLASNFDRIIYKDFYIHDPATCQKIPLFGNVEHLQSIIDERTKPKYQPLRDSAIKYYRQKRMRIIKWRKTLDFFFFVVLIMLLSKLLNKGNVVKYFTNVHLRSMINASGYKNLPDFYSVFNLTQLDIFLLQSYSLSLSKFIHQKTHHMLRKPQFFLFRVKPDYCQVPRVMKSVWEGVGCAASWSISAEDTQVYKPYWIHPKNLDKTYWNEFNLSDWDLHWKDSAIWSYKYDNSFTYIARSGHSYPLGGYNRSLWGEAGVAVSLRDEGWVDHYTRALLTHVSLCNVNTRHISQLTLVAELTVTGEMLTDILVQSEDIVFEKDIWFALFVMSTILYFVTIFMRFNLVGFVGYLTKRHRIFELLMLTFLLYSLGTCAQLSFMEIFYQVDLNTEKEFQLYYFSHLSHMRSVLIVIFILAIFHIYKSHFKRFERHFFKVSQTLMFSCDIVIWLVVIFMLLVTVLFFVKCYMLRKFILIVLTQNFVGNTLGLQIIYFVGYLVSKIMTVLLLVIFIYVYRKNSAHVVNPAVHSNVKE